ncbi:hypothetical protein CERSUDRAFT_76970 [Gelatoporia subvermispora B]|uniref:GED domain-containing protein n=1 Tax=Ceriporiopsis subvermispora (strain B) TaxID=914234 RepID=M2QL85_CERS8|nr:hypothetical protein CERSUDRAFT_76970 [Gelatoporia subvermispora B]
MVAAITNGTSNGGLGLSSAQFSGARRRLLDLINRLVNTGVSLDIDIPLIAVIGQQSAGKSSLIESISGIRLPRASGTCTRCPTECRLSFSPDRWQCTVRLRFETDADGGTLGEARNIIFGDIIYTKDEVEERIRRAQRAILNPDTPWRHFLEDDDTDVANPQLTFSLNCVSLQISGPDVADLSFVDLPGLIASVSSTGKTSDIELVKNLVSSYISKESCIILLTVACETDFENQAAHHLTKQHDPEGKRTIANIPLIYGHPGVLTKPDRIPSGDEGNWLKFITNDKEPLANGYLGFEFQQHLGTAKLTERLSTILSSLIAKRLPEIRDELQSLMVTTDSLLGQLPTAPSDDAFGEVSETLAAFTRKFGQFLKGTPGVDGLLQSIRHAQAQFKRAVRATAPDFRACERSEMGMLPGKATMLDLFKDEEKGSIPVNGERAIYIEDVMERARNAVTRELPGHYPFEVTEYYISDLVSQWRVPAYNLFDTVLDILLAKTKTLIAEHFVQFPRLQQQVLVIVCEYIEHCSEGTMEQIDWHLRAEKRPMTLNDHYYMEYRNKCLAHYKSQRPHHSNMALNNVLRSYSTTNNTSPSTEHQAVSKIMSAFSELNIYGIDPVDLARVLPSDPYEAAIEIMASVRAYFQVAYKRFIDNIPIAIDQDLVLGLDRSHQLERKLRKGLGLNGPDAYQICEEFLREPEDVSLRRDELRKKKERLAKARRELMELHL